MNKPVKPVAPPLRLIKDDSCSSEGLVFKCCVAIVVLVVMALAVLGLLVFCISQIILICSSWG